MLPARAQIRAVVRAAIEEDLAQGDVTTAALFPDPAPARGTIVARQALTLAGVAVAREVFAEVDPSLRIVRALRDGTLVRKGRAVLVVEGDGRSILMAERVALNFLQRLSGIATLTSRFRAAVRGYPTRILDTRKTTPGLRALEKWAVRLGGGTNHRQSLADGILIKDNHLALLRGRGLGLTAACRLARERGPHGLRVIVECQSLEEVRAALDGAADVILLDNLSPADVRAAVGLIKGRTLVEASGRITLETARELAAAGADLLSIGALTHSAPAADLSLDLVPLRHRAAKR
ncbi:carboxylating nicotinate-nucleotide diphosphorylase [Nitrospira sp. Kam-Ns4a]